MGYKGVMRNGAVVLEGETDIPDGAEVRVAPAGRDLSGLLDEASLDDAFEKLHLLYKINRGIQQADAGQTISHEEAGQRLQKWLT